MSTKRFRKSRNIRKNKSKSRSRNRRQHGGELSDSTKILIDQLLEGHREFNPTSEELNEFIRINNHLISIPRWDLIKYIRDKTGKGLYTPPPPSPPPPPPLNNTRTTKAWRERGRGPNN
jgi:hypothetical protein